MPKRPHLPNSSPAQHPLPAAATAVPNAGHPSATRWWLFACGVIASALLVGWGGVRALRHAQTRAALAALKPVASSVPANQPERREAMELADRLLREYPEGAEALYARGILLLRHGFNEEAVKTWKACLKLVPNLALAYEFLGIEACQRGDDERAVEFLRKAVELDPKSSAAGLYLGEALNSLGRMEEAIPVLEQFIQVAPHSAEPYFQLGQAYMYLKAYGRAKECQQAALREDPGFAQACFALAQACERLGETEQAKEYREKHLTLVSEGRKADQRVVRSGRSAAEAKEALVSAYVMVGKVYLGYGRTQEAQACWSKAAAIDPQSVLLDGAAKDAVPPNRTD